jgi:Family of unknown function (DUF6152)
MINVKRFVFGILAVIPIVATAHHSRTLNYTEDLMSLEGDVKSISWRNPHCSFVLETTGENGVKEEWLVEMLAKIALDRNGFDFSALQAGAHVTVTGFKGRRERTLFFRMAKLPNGEVVRAPFVPAGQE